MEIDQFIVKTTQLDEDCQAQALASALRQHGIDVVTTNEADLWRFLSPADPDRPFDMDPPECKPSPGKLFYPTAAAAAWSCCVWLNAVR